MPITPTPAGNPEDLSTAVRQWVHFDNVAENLNKQIANVRALRAEYETKVLELLARQNIRHATLRVTGATLQYATKSKSTDLSWSFLEEQLHEYFRTKGTADQTAEILAFLHRHRGGKTIEYLKKTPLAQSTTTSNTGATTTASATTTKR
jgi:cation transport regulator ChaC